MDGDRGWDGYFALVRQHLDWNTLEKDELDYLWYELLYRRNR